MSKACVLIAEDHRDLLDLLQVVLTSEGFYVATAEDGRKAIDLLTQFRPAVILTDLMMPKVTGIELIRHVRQTPEIDRIPIIVMSAASHDVLSEAEQAGANETIAKPLDFDHLIQTLGKYVPNRAPISE